MKPQAFDRGMVVDAVLARPRGAKPSVKGLDHDYIGTDPRICDLDQDEDLVVLAGDPKHGEHWVVLARKPLLLGIIERCALTPDSTKAEAAALLDLSRRDDVPLELRGRHPRHAAVVTPDPSKPGRWRITFFDSEGPWGHSEATTVLEALKRAVEDGFDALAPGAVERVISGREA